MNTQNDNLLGLEKEPKFIASGAELAYALAITPSAVCQMAGKLKQLPSGKFDLLESCRLAVSELRARKKEGGDSKNLERSLKYWQVEAQKQKVLTHEKSRIKDTIMALLNAQQKTFERFREVVGKYPEVNAAINQMINDIYQVPIDDLALTVAEEGEDNDGFGMSDES